MNKPIMTDCEHGYKISIVIEWVMINGTYGPRAFKKISPCPVDPGPIVVGVFLTLFLVVAVLLSLLLIVTISTSYTLKKYLYMHIVVNICLVILIDCFVNLPLSIAYVTTSPWQFGYNICYFNSFVVLTVTIEMILSIMLFAVDRLLVLRKEARYLSLSKGRLKFVIFLSWMVSIACALPLVCGFTSMPYMARYSCTVSDPNDDTYMIFIFAVLVFGPSVSVIVIAVTSMMIFNKERKKQKKSKGQSYGYMDQILMIPYYRNELYATMCMLILALLFVFLWLPFSSLSTISPILTADWTNKTFDESHEFQDHFVNLRELDHHPESVDSDHHNITDLENANMTSNHVHYIPEVDDYNPLETTLIWFRFIYDLLVPIVILGVLKEVRIKCKSLVLCCQSTTIDALSPKHAPSGFAKTPKSSGFSDIRPTRKKPKKEDKKMVNFKTPVLFATAEGLHIRTIEDTYDDMSDEKNLFGFSKNAAADPKFAYDMCDVFYSASDLSTTEDKNIPTIDASEEIGVHHTYVLNSDEEKNDLKAGSGPERYSTPADSLPSGNKYGYQKQVGKSTNLAKSEKPKKIVRFDTNLNIKISRPNTPDDMYTDDSDSYSSVGSDDSGIYNEELRDRAPAARRRSFSDKEYSPKNNNGRVIHNRKTRGQNPHNRSGNRYAATGSKFANRNRVSPEGGAKSHRGRSRYMDHYRR